MSMQPERRSTRRPSRRASRWLAALFATVIVAASGACGGGSGSGGGGGGGGADNALTIPPEHDSPGLRITITDVHGATGELGDFEPGDRISITFTIQKEDGSACPIGDLDSLRALVSGPTFNYQRVIAETQAPLTQSVDNGDGTYTFKFADKIPQAYLPPYNDSPAYDEGDGELAGQPLLAGTYTIGLYGYYDYIVLGPVGEGEAYRDVGDTTANFLLGATKEIVPRDVVGLANCNNCHVRLQAHGGFRRNLTICLMCHTAGAEDRNTGGATPGVSVDFRIMIHKLHNARSLPSVLGVTTNPDGSRNYDAEPMPYELVGFGGNVHDFSDVGLPVWPSLTEPTLRDEGYSDLLPDEQQQETTINLGAVACGKCHGDPDGDGPAEPPVNGDLAYFQLSRAVCGSCHDDIVWEYPYTANGATMPPLDQDGSCVNCHAEKGDSLAVRNGHLHPLLDPAFNPGLHFNVLAVAAAGGADGGAILPGNKLEVTFSITDDAGLAVDPSDVASLSATLSGPTWNLNLLLNQAFPLAALTDPQPFTVNLPQTRLLEFVGRSTGAPDEEFMTSGAPLWDALGVPTIVYAVSAAGPGSGASATDASSMATQNFVDVDDPTGFDRNDVVVIDAGLPGAEEYLRIQFVEANRLWFSSPATSGYPPALRFDHAPGAPVTEVLLTELTVGVDYVLDDATGTITEMGELGAGIAMLVSYTTDYVLPELYPGPLNDSPVLGQRVGEWRGKTLVEGTYLLAMWGNRPVDIVEYDEPNSYRGASDDEAFPFVVGPPGPVEPWDLIDSAQACYACHDRLLFHGGGRGGFDTCLVCHGTSGSEDRPKYVAVDAPPTTGLSINFREMLHKIHMGAELANASAYTVVGFGLGYPMNFSEHMYDEVHFPALPSGTKDCVACHGPDNEAWQEPGDRNHPTEQTAPVLAWTDACITCHDSGAAVAHAQSNTSMGGVEACAVCHDPGSSFNVAQEHKIR